MIKSKLKFNKRGFFGITLAVIVTVIILAVSVSFSNSNILGRFDSNFFEDKSIAFRVAQGCLEYARLKLAENSSYTGNETVGIGSYSCTINQITEISSQKSIPVTATVRNQTSNLRMYVDVLTLKFAGLEEFTSF